MIFKNVNVNEVQNRELAEIVRQLRKLTDGGYDLYDKNDKAILRLLKKALKMAKDEREWYIYFDGLFDIIYQYGRSGNDRQIVRYAEIYYKDSELYMDKVLPDYAHTDLAFLNTWIYDMIFDAYEEYCQIDDAKMKTFMEKYEEAGLKYGKAYCYYNDEMSLALLYRDKKLAEHGRKYFEKYEKELASCYVCGHKVYLGYYLLFGQREKAEKQMLDFINKNIPKRHQWCYQYCESAAAGNMYKSVLNYCILLGRVEDFHYFYKKYWEKQPRENWYGEEGDGWETFSAYLCAISGNFDFLEKNIEQAMNDIKECGTYSTIANMKDGIEWYCYFTLLEKSGITEVAMKLPGVVSDGDGMIPCGAVIEYMNAFGDDYGKKFEKARAEFDFLRAKRAYLECAGLFEPPLPEFGAG